MVSKPGVTVAAFCQYNGISTTNAAAAMANYDPKFNEVAKPGDIMLCGRNFGSGSSREQAATCLLSCGIRCVIAACEAAS